MSEVLNKIIKACFEGFFGTMVAGWTFYTFQSIRKNRGMLIWLWLVLIGMAIWRFFIPNFYSPRYAAIFLFPAILLTTYMMVIFKKWWWVLLAVLGIICCCKILRTNPTGRLLIETAKLIRKDAASWKHPLIIVDIKDAARMKFYSALPVFPFDERRSYTKRAEDFARIIRNNTSRADAVYICCDILQDHPIKKENLTLPGEWKLLFSVLRNRKKNVYFHIYRYCHGIGKPSVPKSGKKQATTTQKR